MIALLLATTAFAENPNGSLLLGVGALPDSGDPVTTRFGARLGIPVAANEVVGFDAVFPLEVATSGDSGFGFQSRNTALELAPTARLRFAPESPVRAYLDAGVGFAHRFSRTDTWFGDVERNRTTPMFRSGVGFEFGGTEPGALALVVEPIGWRHYGLDGSGADQLAFLAGIHFNG